MIFINKIRKAIRLIMFSAEAMIRQQQLQPVKVKKEKQRYGKSIFILLIALFSLTGFDKTQAQVRHNYGFSIGTGLYAAEGFGTSFSAALRVNKYFSQGRHFVEGSFGITNFESEVLKAIGNTQFFEHNRLMTFEFLYGYDPKMWSSLPYFTMGVASINQGGQSRFAGILGIGNRIYFDTLFGSSKMGLRYDLRDHIFKQSYNRSKEFFTHNLNLSLNLEFFF